MLYLVTYKNGTQEIATLEEVSNKIDQIASLKEITD